jgi:hypothetical protein
VTDPDRLDRYRHRVFGERDRLNTALADGIGSQRAVLADLTAHNAATHFGREHGFDRIRTLDDFRKSVPIRDYTGLAPWIERTANGESSVLTADDPVVYFTSSGSTGAPKKIPVTRQFMRTTFFPFYYAAWAPMAEHFPEVVAEPDAVLNLKHDPRPAMVTTPSGRPHLGASQIDFGTTFGEPLSAEPGSRASWETLPGLVAPDDHLEKAYLRLRRAVEADVRCVIGINPAMVAALPYQLLLWLPRIVKDIRDGTLGGTPYREPNPGRAAELERLTARFGSVRPAHIWPNMRVIFCWTTGVASLYLPRLREEFGIGVTVLPAPVAASEGPVGVALDRHGSAGSLVVTASVYEFVDADEELVPDAPTLEPHELEAGREYHVVFSHVGGLYRYAVGDVVRVVDMAAGVPRVEYAGRATTCGVAGERLRDAHVIRSAAAATAATGLELRNVSCHPPASAGEDAGYQVAVAPQEPWSATEKVRYATVFDEALATLAPGYRAARDARRLAAPALTVLPANAFLRAWHAEVAAGVRPAQVKDRVFRKDPAAWQRLVSQPDETQRGQSS